MNSKGTETNKDKQDSQEYKTEQLKVVGRMRINHGDIAVMGNTLCSSHRLKEVGIWSSRKGFFKVSCRNLPASYLRLCEAEKPVHFPIPF